MRLGVRVGQGCATILDHKMRGLDCRGLQVDEIWGYVAKKQKRVLDDDPGLSDVWTFIALDRKSKLIPSYLVGKRDSYHANAFMEDLAARLKSRVQLTSDSLK